MDKQLITETFTEIRELIRKRPDWEGTHKIIEHKDGNIFYYDTDANDYFLLRNEKETVRISHFMIYPRVDIHCTLELMPFDITTWLLDIKKKLQERVMVLDGKKYILTEIKEGGM